MIRHPLIGLAIAGGAFVAASPALAQNCSRESLQAAVDSYIAAQEAGDRALMQFHAPRYEENRQPVDISTGFINTPQPIDYHNVVLDEEQCEAFTEVVILNPEHPYVLGTNLKIDEDGLITEIGTIITDDDDWLFSAERFHEGIRDEDWSEIPLERRDSRETLIAAANDYMDMFMSADVDPPWAEVCHRQEGGMRTDGSCASEPLGVEFPDRRFIVDPTIGAVVAVVPFKGATGERPDSHRFRLNDGRIRYIHTITNCTGDFNCGFDLSDDLRAEREARGGRVE